MKNIINIQMKPKIEALTPAVAVPTSSLFGTPRNLSVVVKLAKGVRE